MAHFVTLGIDPGLDGGLAWIDLQGVHVAVTPTVKAGGGRRHFDRRAMRSLLIGRPVDLCVLELVSAVPAQGRKQGALSSFNFGSGWGMWLGLLAGLEIPHQLVRPQAWKKQVLSGTEKDKAAAIAFCQARYPHTSLLATARSRKPHDGIADALCLANHAQHLLGVGQEDPY